MGEHGPVGIVVAVSTEFDPLCEQMTDVVVSDWSVAKYHRGKLGGIDVVLAQCGVGRVNAAAVTAVLCAQFMPRCVINSGSAGGLVSHLKIGDVVIAGTLVYGDVDNRCFGYRFGQLPGMPEAYTCCRKLGDDFQRLSEARGYSVCRGNIVTVDSFVATDDVKGHILGHFPEAMAVEMEGCAVAQVCETFKIPSLVVRSISDTANDHVDYNDFAPLAGRRSAEVTKSLLPLL